MSEDQITEKLKSTCKNLIELLRSGYTTRHPSYFEVAKALVHASNALLERDINNTLRENAQYTVNKLTAYIEAHDTEETHNVPS